MYPDAVGGLVLPSNLHFMTRKCHQPQTEPVASARGGGQQRGSEKMPMTPFSTEVPAGGRAPSK